MSEYFRCPCCGTSLVVSSTTGPRDRRKRLDWESVDWSEPNVAIARRLQCTPDLVSYKRARYAPESLRRVKYYDWSMVDWRQTNREIAQALGATENYVSVKRHSPRRKI